MRSVGLLRFLALRGWRFMAACALLMLARPESSGQCTNTTAFGTVAAPTNNAPLTISTCTYQSEYNTITGIVAGQTYSVGSSCGGYVTVRRTTYNGVVVANGNAPLSFTAPVAGTYYLHFNTSAACGTASICCTTTITCTSCTATVGCVNTVAYASLVAPVTPAPQTITTCSYQTEYSTITGIVAGATYTVTNSCGGYITVRHTTYNGTLVAQGSAPLTFTATVAGTYFLHWNTNAACGTSSTCCTTTIACTSCSVSPPAGACTAVNIPSLPVTGQAVVCHGSNLISAPYVTSLCGTATTIYLGGNEALYTVTPTTTGSYAINYAGQTWSSIWVFSGACPAAGGTCVGSVSSSTATQSLVVSMTAGVQYWILFDTFPSPPSPCPGTFSISNVPPPVVASDCNQAVNVCTNINFQIDPNGFGTTNEIPALGTTGNPDFWAADAVMSPWGSDNWGCLRSGELNSTWMVVNVLTGGSLQFTFGGLGTQTGFYDWIMYPFNASACAQVAGNTLSPVRCNWNGVSTGGTGLASPPPAGGDPTNYEPPLTVGSYTQWLICFSNWSSVSTAVPLQFGGTAVVSCSPLPVEMLHFDANVVGASVALEWITASEQNTSRFIVERSVDGASWTELATVHAAGFSSTPRLYKHLDHAPHHGVGYYRLRTLDVDGAESLSVIRTVRFSDSWIVAPNPTTGSFTVLRLPENSRPRLFDAFGREMPVAVTRFDGGSATVDATGASPGVYQLRFNEDAGAALRVVIER